MKLVLLILALAFFCSIDSTSQIPGHNQIQKVVDFIETQVITKIGTDCIDEVYALFDTNALLTVPLLSPFGPGILHIVEYFCVLTDPNLSDTVELLSATLRTRSWNAATSTVSLRYIANLRIAYTSAATDFGLKIQSSWTFNAAGKITNAVLDLMNGPEYFAFIEKNEPSFTSLGDICSTILTNCAAFYATPTGASFVYTSIGDCEGFLASLGVATATDPEGNTIGCRALHTRLTLYDPDLHCMHVSKSGGGICVANPTI